ncbi:hypothetical protein V502_06637 [Pseudogymnoascus sp. VKM F-4520 (FW-2644)]|nr:hypothetical protein V502_06637 [Pseudogymnoascus sp. VKM F-4520 (FW-2644)]
MVSQTSSTDKDIHDVWGYKYEWTDLHWTEEQQLPLRYSYDTLGEDVLARVKDVQMRKAAENGEAAGKGAPRKTDLYESLKSSALSKEDPVVTKFWEDMHTVPEWVDWDQIKRGQDVFYRYGEASMTGLAFSSLLGGMAAARIVETLARTGGFAPRVARNRMLETTQFVLQVTNCLKSVQPGGDGHVSAIRVRLLHAMVRNKILAMAKEREDYYNVEEFGTPINDIDSIGTISTFSAQLIWIALPAQGIYMREQEIEDYVALWRLVAYYMGTPTDPLRTPASTKAIMESILEADLKPSNSSKVLAANIIQALADKAPTYPSADYLRAQARWLNGSKLADALEIPKSSYLSITLVLVQCLVICASSYTYRSIPMLDRWKVEYMRRRLYHVLMEGKHGMKGKKTKYELQYVPGFNTVTEQGEVARGLSIGKVGSRDTRNLIILGVLLVILGSAIMKFTSRGDESSSEQKGGEVEQVEDERYETKPPTFGGKIKNHYKRFWWAHLIAFCAGFLIVALCLVYVAMPKIAQKGIDDATLSYTSLKFMKPSLDSLTLSVDALQHSDSPFTPTLDAFNVSMHLVTDGITSEKVITQIGMPEIHARHPDTNIVIEGQKATIVDMDQVAAFAKQVLTQESIEVRMEGKTKLHLGALPVNSVNYNSSITFKALNGLKGFNITEPKVNLMAEPGEPNLTGMAFIPNPSVLTVEMGTVMMHISTKEKGLIGNSTIENFVLKPGENLLPMKSTVDTALALGSVDDKGMVNMIIVGQTAVYNGVHLPYYETALKSHTLTLAVNLQSLLSSV